MATNLICQRHNRRKVSDLPASWRSHSKIYHAADARNEKHVHPLEVSYNSVQSNPKTGFSKFFRRCGPFNANAEEVTADSF